MWNLTLHSHQWIKSLLSENKTHCNTQVITTVGLVCMQHPSANCDRTKPGIEMTRLDFYWLALFSITQQKWLTLTNSNIQYIRQIQINMFYELKKKKQCEKAQSGVGLEHPEKTLRNTRRRCWIPDIPSSNLGFGNNRKKGVDPSWVSLWNRSRCPLMTDRWRQRQTKNTWTDMCTCRRKQIFMTMAKIQRLTRDMQGLWLRWEPRTHPLPLPVLPEDTGNATLKDGKKRVGETQGFFVFELISDWYWPLEWLRNTSAFGYLWLCE